MYVFLRIKGCFHAVGSLMQTQMALQRKWRK